MKNIFTFILCFIASSGAPLNSYANWGETLTGSDSTGNLKMYGGSQVELVNEDLHIELRQKEAVVDVKYVFRNTGPDITVKAGFPSRYYFVNSDRSNPQKENEVQNYEIHADGKPVAFQREKGNSNERFHSNKPSLDEMKIKAEWLASKIPFTAQSEKVITIHYRSPYLVQTQGTSSQDQITAPKFTYLLSTASPWKGPIQKGKITLSTIGYDPTEIKIQPKGRFKQEGPQFTWEFSELEPTRKDDFVVTLGSSKKSFPQTGVDENFLAYRFPNGKSWAVYQPSEVLASSVLSTGSPHRYDPLLVTDGQLDTAWVEGKSGEGLGESITLKYKTPKLIDQFAIYPGYGKSWDLYHTNDRLAEVELTLNHEHKQTFSLPDAPGKTHLLNIQNYSKPVSIAVFKVLKIYPGNKDSDLAISEIESRQTKNLVIEDRVR